MPYQLNVESLDPQSFGVMEKTGRRTFPARFFPSAFGASDVRIEDFWTGFKTTIPLGSRVGGAAPGSQAALITALRNVVGQQAVVDATMARLFVDQYGNELPGVWYDPSDLTTMFQGGQGQSSVAATGQVAGTLLDKSKGLVLGGVIPYEVATPTGTVTNNGNGTWTLGASSDVRFAYPISALAAGASYRVEFTASGLSGTVNTDWCDVLPLGVVAGGNSFISSRSTYDDTYRFVDIVTAAASGVTFTTPGVRLVAGNHCFQTTSAYRPIFRDIAGLRYLEFDGVDDWLRTTFTIAQPIDRISGLQQVTSTPDDRLFGGVATSSGSLYQTGTSPRMALFSGAATFSIGDLAVGVNGVVTERHDGASSRLAANNVAYGTGNAGTTVPGGITIGASDLSANPGNLFLHQLIMRGGAVAMTDAEIAACRRLCAAKAGVSL